MKQIILFFLSCIAIIFIPQNITAGNPPALHDIAVGPFLSMPGQFFAQNNYNIKARVTNLGTSGETNVPVKFSVNGIQIGTGSIPSMPPGAVDSVSFTWAPPTQGFYTLRIYSAMAVDENRLNDTVTVTRFVLPAGSQNPQITFCRHVNKLISDNSTVYDTIFIGAVYPCVVLDVNVLIDTILHTWVSDLNISLIHNNINDTIFCNQGGSGDNLIGVWFNDSAGLNVPPVPTPGTYKPCKPLSIFNGTSYNDIWILRIRDDFNGDIGYLRAWCVQITFQPCGGIIPEGEIPRNYFLSQNYPNPFNPVTIINYGIPKAGNVTLKIFDMIGRELYTLVNESKPPGIYSVEFDASELTSGVYLYSIETESFSESKKMVLIK